MAEVKDPGLRGGLDVTQYDLAPELRQKGAQYVGLLGALGYEGRAFPYAPLQVGRVNTDQLYTGVSEPVKLHAGGSIRAFHYGRAPAPSYRSGVTSGTESFQRGVSEEITGPRGQLTRGSGLGRFMRHMGRFERLLRRWTPDKEKHVRVSFPEASAASDTASRRLEFLLSDPPYFDAYLAPPTSVRISLTAPKRGWEHATSAGWWPDFTAETTWAIDEWRSRHLVGALRQTYAEMHAALADDWQREGLAKQISVLAATMLNPPRSAPVTLGFEDDAPVLNVPTERRVLRARVVRRGRPTPMLALSDEERQEAAEDWLDA